MTAQGWLQIAFYVGFLTLAAIPLGRYMARVYEGENVLLSRILGPLERLIYGSLGKSARVEQDWKAYAKTVSLQPPVLARALPPYASREACRSTRRASAPRRGT